MNKFSGILQFLQNKYILLQKVTHLCNFLKVIKLSNYTLKNEQERLKKV